MSVPYLKLGITAPIAGTPYLASDRKVFSIASAQAVIKIPGPGASSAILLIML